MNIIEFVRESNRIEGIYRDPTQDEITIHILFQNSPKITIQNLEQFVSICAGDWHYLREKVGMNVTIGNHIAPEGGPKIREQLENILSRSRFAEHPWLIHTAYENLHPFTDGNGRSGRALWLWQMKEAPLGFLHTFYYQTLEMQDLRKK
ncbi:MAG: Fic family protein [Gammaproteobacteria bacterium]|nr:Fic family protein [Gammaproteobacteria bacterium]